MRVCYGWGRKPLSLSREQRYREESLIDLLRQYLAIYSTANPLLRVPIWIQVEEEYVRLETDSEVRLACRIASIYHNSAVSCAPQDDGWYEETAQMEMDAARGSPSVGHGGVGEDESDMQGDYVRI